ncbi:hypothetical protein SteCoe_17267 [Stentor coeruleus]|uniref:Ankyrin repeat domain-containing protein n=1 Tax=Stentor coeruleus TaxID=5963 RepID=A0A1R2BZA5_9CILI|nr:hypothetical protein SteCoe_17267 [Stentor coeruleus]
MKKRWGLIEFQSACNKTRDSISQKSFKDLAQNDKKHQILRALNEISNLSNYHIRFFPYDQPKTIKRLRKCIPPRIWEKPLSRIFFFEYWKGLETTSPGSFLKDSMLRYIYGVNECSNDLKSYPLHCSVFNSDLYRIHKLCVGEDPNYMFTDIDKVDDLGNTPLMLAVKLRKHEEALVLVDHGADPKYRKTSDTLSPIELALGMQDRKMLKILITGYLRRVREKWLNHIDEFIEALERMKDFSLTMRWECKSSIIPFVKRFTPSDVYQIYKRGTNVRVDLTLIGWESLKTLRGNISLLFKGHKKKLVIFDHVTGIKRDFDTEPSEAMIENTIEKLLKGKKFSNEIQVNDVNIIPDKNWRGETQTEIINNWKCKKKKLTCSIEIDREKRQVVYDKNIEKFKNFEEYFEYVTNVSSFNERPLPSQTVIEPKMVKHYSKQLNASLWTCEDFPLTLKDFFPLLELLASFSKNAQYLCAFFHQGCLDDDDFPVKALIPVYASVKLLVHLDSVTMIAPDFRYFSFPKNEEKRSEDTTGKLGDWSSEFLYKCEVSYSDDDNLIEAQEIFLSLKSLDATPLLTDTSVEIEDPVEEEMPDISILEYHHKLPPPKVYNRNSLPNTILKRGELFKKVKIYAMNYERISKNDADVVL